MLAAAINMPELTFDNTKVSLYPDYSPEIQQQRRSFMDVHKRLRGKGLKYSLLYPSKLRIVNGGSTRYLDCLINFKLAWEMHNGSDGLPSA